MGLETVTSVDDLVKTNPVASDKRHQSDNHHRIIKTALKHVQNGVLGMTDTLPDTLTISLGDVAPPADSHSFFVIAAQSGTADTLDTITQTNLYDGAFILIKPDAGDTITVTDAKGAGDEIILSDSTDLVMSSTDQFLLLFVDKTNSKNYEVFRSGNLEPGEAFTTMAAGSNVVLTEVPRYRPNTRTVVQTPTDDRTNDLPTTNVLAGDRYVIMNLAAAGSGFDCIMQPSDQVTSYTITPTNSLVLMATQAAPTSGTHWRKVGGQAKFSLYAANDTFTVPAFVHQVFAKVTGGGGGSGGGRANSGVSASGGGGGGAGGTAQGLVATTPGTAMAVVAGARGALGGGGAVGSAGADSTFGGLTGSAGAGGGSQATGSAGGAGGSASGGDTAFPGGDGAPGVAIYQSGTVKQYNCGGQGGSSLYGGHGQGGRSTSGVGTQGEGGSGGGGGAGNTEGTESSGAQGGRGFVSIEY